MKACSRCGFYNTDERDRCLKCQAILDHDWGAAQHKVRLRRIPFHHLTAAVANLGLELRRLFTFYLPEECPRRRPWPAGFMGLLPGLGQIYNRQYKKTLFLFPVFIALLGLVVLTIVHPLSYVCIAALIGWMLFSFADALIVATRINGQEWSRKHTVAMFSALVFYLGVFFSLSQFFLLGIFVGVILYCLYNIFWPGREVNKAKAWTTVIVVFGVLITTCVLGRTGNPVLHKWVYWSQDNLAPAIRKGDFIYVDCVTYWFRRPRLGDIVYYDPKTFTIKLGRATTLGGMPSRAEDIYIVNLRNAMERVVALPGDTFKREKGKFYRNGELVAPHLEPLHPSGLPGAFDFKVPRNRYLVLISYGVSESMPLTGTQRAPSPAEGASPDWGPACMVARGEIFGRCLFIWHPIKRRQWLTPK